jgi:hypothetical protein
MTDKQENILRMYYAVSAVCDTNIEIWQENEVFSASYRKLQTKIPEILKHREIIKMEDIASESFKRFDRIELEEMGFYISGKLLIIANNTSNKNLNAQISPNRNNLIKADDTELVTICNIIAQNATLYNDKMAELGILSDDLAEFQQFISYFASNINRIRHYVLKNKSSQELIKKLFKDVDDILKNNLDPDIEFFKNSDPDFYNQYKAAREVINFEYEPAINFSSKMVNYTN